MNHPKIKSLFENAKRLASTGDFAQALKTYNEVIDLDAEHAQAYFERGTCYYRLGNYRRAADDIDTACLLGYETAQIWSRIEGVQVSGIIEDEPF